MKLVHLNFNFWECLVNIHTSALGTKPDNTDESGTKSTEAVEVNTTEECPVTEHNPRKYNTTPRKYRWKICKL